MKLPRDVSSQDLVKALKLLGYEVSHQTGSHIRLTTQREGEHHITIPAHNPLKVGTLKAIVRDIGNHFQLDRDKLLKQLFAK
jgi:predicted RNA binding protein YcfA (HicA-like mRNA interferase family)